MGTLIHQGPFPVNPQKNRWFSINVLLAKPVLLTRFSAATRHDIMNLAKVHSSMTAQTILHACDPAHDKLCSGSTR
jgi:hypothetical protein